MSKDAKKAYDAKTTSNKAKLVTPSMVRMLQLQFASLDKKTGRVN